MIKSTYIKEEINNSESINRVSEHIEAYLLYLRSVKQSDSTVLLKERAVKRFFSCPVAENIGDVDTKMLEDHRGYLVRSGLSESTVDLHMRSLKDFFKYLEKHNLIFDNPFRQIKLHAVKKRRMDILTTREVKKLLCAPSKIKMTHSRNRAILETLYSTGMRRDEITNLKIRDVDLAGRTVRVFGKGKKERILPLGRIAAEYIDAYLVSGRPILMDEKNPNCDDLWLDMNGNKMKKNTLYEMVKCAGKRAGLGKTVSPHMLRRTCATHMLMNGAHPLMISQMLGHTCLKVLSHYLNISLSEMMQTHRQSRPGS